MPALWRDPRTPTEVAVGVVWRDDGSVLLADRPAGKPYAGFWEFPGGKFEAGESASEALTRELHEELGILVHASDPWLVLAFTYPHAFVRLHFRRVRDWSGSVHGREGQQWGFFHPSDLPPGRLLPAAVPVWRTLGMATTGLRSPGHLVTAANALSWFQGALDRGVGLFLWEEPALDVAAAAGLEQEIAALAWRWKVKLFLPYTPTRAACGPIPGVAGLWMRGEDLRRGARRPPWGWLAARVADAEEADLAWRLACEFICCPDPGAAAPQGSRCPIYLEAAHSLVNLKTAWGAGAHGLLIDAVRGL